VARAQQAKDLRAQPEAQRLTRFVAAAVLGPLPFRRLVALESRLPSRDQVSLGPVAVAETRAVRAVVALAASKVGRLDRQREQ
jgi:hypothetical protein